MIKKVENNGYKNSNYGMLRIGNDNPHTSISRPSFTGKVPQMPTSSLKDAIEYILPKSAKILKKMGSNSGEIQNIIINAAGTGLVAPVFIKYNFLSDADEDTRTYSAWRQPLSAILAVVTQAGLTAPFYRIFDNWSNNGSFGEALNKTPFQDDYYIKKLVKQQYPNATKQQTEDLINKFKENQKQNLLRTLEEESTVIYTRPDGSKFKISDKAYRNLLNETIDGLVKVDTEILRNIDKTITKRTARSKYYRAHNKEAADLLNEFHTKISSATDLNEINSFLSNKISELRANKNSEEMISILDEIRHRAKVVYSSREAISFSDVQQALLEKVAKMQEHVKKYNGIKSDEEVEQLVKNIVAEEKGKIQSALNFYKSIKASISEKTNINELRKLIEEKCKELKIEDSGLNKNFIEEVANKLISRAKTNMKWYKQFVGVFVSLSMLPFTCTLLNWIYPRFMDVFFPNLSSKKHDNESAKLVSMAPKVNTTSQTANTMPTVKTSPVAPTVPSPSRVSMDSFIKKAEVA